MSAHANIVIQDDKGEYDCTYLYLDGDLEAAGWTLHDSYTTSVLACDLLWLGDLAVLGPHLGLSISYWDRGADWLLVRPHHGHTISQALQAHRLGRQEYVYVWRDGQWWVDRGKVLHRLSDILHTL